MIAGDAREREVLEVAFALVEREVPRGDVNALGRGRERLRKLHVGRGEADLGEHDPNLVRDSHGRAGRGGPGIHAALRSCDGSGER